MKIMDLSGDDEECQVDAVVDSKTKKSKQARLPFQALVSDSPVANKKRKLPASPGCRNAKQPKVNTKENAFKVSKKNETDNIVDLDQKDAVEKEETNSNNETDDVKDSSKTTSTEDTDIKNKKSTPGKGPGKVKKPEKIQASPLTKFFKKVEKSNTESKSEQTSTNKNKEEDSGSMKSVNNNTKNIVNMTSNKKDESTSQEKGNNEKSQDLETDKKDNASKIKNKSEAETDKKENDSKNRNKSEDSDKEESDKDELSHVDTSCLDESDKMDVDSDILLSDDSDDDSGKSDTDSKRTEHEDTDSKDDRSNETKVLTPTRNKLLDSSSKNKKLTPKQLERKLEIQKKRESREKQRLEREQKLQEERESRKKEKEEKKREREEKEKLLKEQKRKDKELKELKKQAEMEQKQKEKEAKEEDRRKREEAKEEERKRKEEERLEAERKKLKAASNFVSFFVAKRPTETKVVEEETKVEGRNFMPFEIKADMRVAPRTRRNLTQSEKSKLDELIINSDAKKSELYIYEIKNKKYSLRKSERTWPFESSNDDDIIVLEGEDEESANIVQAGNGVVEKHRAKLLLFGDNRRPPYWGTWRKKSKSINPRRPFTKDTKWFDYEVDSDDEWEEEEPGESIHGSEDEKEKDEENAEENEYDVDNDFMVPHGYLSEEEIGADEEDDDEEEGGLNPENQKTKLKILGEQFEAERNAKTKKLKPKVIGCIWLAKNNAYPESMPPYAVEFLTARHAWVREIPVVLTAPAEADKLNDTESGTPSHKHASSARKAKAMEEAMPDLIRLLHYNPHGRGFLVKEFIEFWSKKREGEKPLPKMKVHQKFQEIAKRITCSDPGPMNGKACWYVNDEIRTKYLGEEKLDVLNNWTYCLIPKRKNVAVEAVDKADEKEKEKEKEKKTIPLITQFTKTLTAEEMQKQLLADKVSTPTSKAPEKTLTPTTKLIENPTASISGAKATPPLNRPPKRASLISVPRGESFPKSPRVSLMDKFVTKDSLNVNGTKNDDKSVKVNIDDDDDCMIIDDSDEADAPSVSSKANNVKKVDESDSKANKNISTKEDIDSDKSLNISNNSDVDIMKV